MKDLGEATYILGIKIYRDRSRRLIGLSQSTYLDKILKKLSKSQNPTTTEDREMMKIIPYASVIGSIKYAMLCTRTIVCLAMSLTRGYNSDLGVDHWTTVKI